MAETENKTTYQWPEGSLIRRIEVRQEKHGLAVAYLYADYRPELLQQRADIRSIVRLKGWGTLSDHRNGEFALRVSGLRNGRELIDTLTQAGYLQDEPASTNSTTVGQHSRNLWEFIKNNSLRASGLIYMIGNGLYYMVGVARNKTQPGSGDADKAMALSFAAGDALLGIFGGRDDELQFKSLLKKMKDHMEENGIEIPKNAAIHIESSNRGRDLLGRMADVLHEHINLLKCSAEVLGGYFALKSGLRKDAAGNRNNLKALGGAVVMGGWAAALLTKEKKPDDEKLKDAGPVDRAIAHIQEKPLRLAGWAGLAFNALNFGSTWGARGEAYGKWNMAAVGSMVSANALYSISNKTTGGDIKTEGMVRDVYSVAAQILNKQPDNVREAAIESTAKFLGERPEIKDTHQQIIVRLKEEMHIQRQNPWFEQRGLPPYQVSPLGTTPVPNLAQQKTPQLVINSDSAVLVGQHAALNPEVAH